MADAIELARVTKRFGKRVAVDALSVHVPEGSLYGLIGPNGSGKTTTLRMILRIFHPDEGVVFVLGRAQGKAADDRLGYLPEERGLYRRMTVRAVLRFYARLKGMARPELAIDRWLERLALRDRADVRIDTLSKGLAQKVQFAAAVVHDPKLLILDEPFSGLDPVNADVLRDVILELRRAGSTVVFSTHDMSAAERLCDCVMMLHRGQKVLDGPVDAIRRERSAEVLRVRFAEHAAALADPDIARVRDYGREHMLELKPGADPQSVLRRLLEHGRLLHFSVTSRSLHEIFVDIAGAPVEPVAATYDHEQECRA